jgi:hypothetical protein
VAVCGTPAFSSFCLLPSGGDPWNSKLLQANVVQIYILDIKIEHEVDSVYVRLFM